MLAVDAATHPTPALTKEAGYRCVAQYLAGSHAMPAAYPSRCTGGGVGLISAWELAATAALGGAAQGDSDAAAAIAAAESYGQPKGTVIYAAVDFKPEGAQVTSVVAYAEAWAKGVRGAGYLAGVYGGVGTVDAVRGKVDRLWQTAAWSTGVVAEGNALYQSGSVQVAGVTCDLDEILSTPGAWTLDGPLRLLTPPQEDIDMKWGIQTYDGDQWLIVPGPFATGAVRKRARIATPTDTKAWEAMGAVGVSFSEDVVAAMPVVAGTV